MIPNRFGFCWIRAQPLPTSTRNGRRLIGLGQSNSIKSASLSFPGVKLLNQNFSLQRLGFWIYNGHAADGLLGFDFISRFVIEIDYVTNTISLHEPNSFKYSGSGEIVPLTLLEDDSGGKVPLVQVKITQQGRAAIEGKFIADTAVRSAISFNTPFVDANKLLQSAQKTIQVPLGGGAMVRESKQSTGACRLFSLDDSFSKNESLSSSKISKELSLVLNLMVSSATKSCAGLK